MTELCNIAYKHKTDKCPQIFHTYTPFYYNLLKDKKDSIKKVLEFGIGSEGAMAIAPGYIPGGSLRMWRDFFPNATVYGADILDECMFEEERIQTHICDEREENQIKDLINKIGPDIDLVIDDAVHTSGNQIFLCLTLMPLLNDDVIYIIEDCFRPGKIIHKIRGKGYYCWEAPLEELKRSRSNNVIVVTKKPLTLPLSINKEKGIIYYTDNRARDIILTTVQKILTNLSLKLNLPISSSSLRPIDFGNNVVLENRERSYPTMVRQIIMALEQSKSKYVFFCENDVLYHESHFDFTPPRDDIFYYNSNVWRWRLWDDKAIRYQKMWPLSCLCSNREFVLEHYRMREQKIYEWGLNEFRSREPRRARIWGYEPGTKQKRRGGLTNDVAESWASELPNVDMRHARTFSRLKCTQDDFTHIPEHWEEISIYDIPGWNLNEVFDGQLDSMVKKCIMW